jgi:SNF2 family DNA or RNA helicase
LEKLLKFTFENFHIFAQCETHENEMFRKKGFAWIKELRQWATPFSAKARAFLPQMNEAERALFKEHVNLEKITYELSGALDSEYSFSDALFPYQKAGVHFLIDRHSVLLADQMGLGKTLQVIDAMNHIDPQSVLIICPASIKNVWKDEIKKWGRLNLSVSIWGKDTKAISGINIVNYDVLKKFSFLLHAVKWDVLVLDEAHYIKNPNAIRTVSVCGGRIKSKNTYGRKHEPIEAKRKYALTGTPILNRPSELYSVLKFLLPYGFPSKTEYLKRYCDLKLVHGRWDSSGASNLEELQRFLRSSIMIRRVKEDVLTDLPPKIRQIVEVEPSAAVKRKLDAELKNLDETDYRNAVKALDFPKRLSFDCISSLRKETATSKIDIAIKHLRECLESGKVIAFCHHKAVAEGLASAFKFLAVSVTGETPIKKRAENVKAFQEDSSVRLFIGNIEAAGVGLTLTASSHVVFVESAWEPGKMNQAEDRAHRIGQKSSVLIQHLVWADSLDAYMAKTVISKQETIEGAVDVLTGDFLR